MVGLPEIILDVIIFGWNPKFYKLVFESSALLEKTMYLALDFNLFIFLLFMPYSVTRARLCEGDSVLWFSHPARV